MIDLSEEKYGIGEKTFKINKNKSFKQMEVLSLSLYISNFQPIKGYIMFCLAFLSSLKGFQLFLGISPYLYIFIMFNSSHPQLIRQKYKSESSSAANKTSSSYSQIEGSFIDNAFFDKFFLLNSEDCTERANQTFFSKITIEKIKVCNQYIEIKILQDRKKNKMQNCNKVKKQIKKNLNPQNTYLQSNLDQLDNRLTINFSQFKQFTLQNPNEGTHKQYLEWLKTMDHRNFISWFLPLGQRSSYLNSFTISNKTLALLGYTPDQAAIQLINYKSNSLNSILNNKVYSTMFWIYLNTLCKFMSVQLECYLAQQDVKSEGQRVISTVLIGKNQRRIAAEINIFMASPFIVCMQVLGVAKGEKFFDASIELDRKQIEQKQVQKNRNQLSHIIKFPKQQQKQRKVCSYIVIDNFLQ